MERHYNEQLTDNTQISYCQQCRQCAFWGMDGKDPYSNAYDKASCAMYPHPDHKPSGVLNNTEPCPFRVERKQKG